MKNVLRCLVPPAACGLVVCADRMQLAARNGDVGDGAPHREASMGAVYAHLGCRMHGPHDLLFIRACLAMLARKPDRLNRC